MESTYEIPMEMNNVEGTYDTLMNTVEAQVRVGTIQTGYLKIRTVIIIFLILIIIFIGVCIGIYFAGKASAESKDGETDVPKVTPGSSKVINATRTSPKSSTPESTSSTPPTPKSISCLDGWVKHGKSCYFFGKDSFRTFSEAVSFCQGYKAKLIEVDSDSENQFVKDYLSKLEDPHFYYLMGLTDVTNDGTFLLFSSNKTASFVGWADGEPNNSVTDEDCVAFDKGYNYNWNDVLCIQSFNRATICEL